MEQIVTVMALEPDGTALVRCVRASACSGNCDRCGGCAEGETRTLEIRAENPIGAEPGDRVVVASSTPQILGAVAAVYLLPPVLLLGGYLLAGPWAAAAGAALGIGACVALDRYRARKKKTVYTITAFARM